VITAVSAIVTTVVLAAAGGVCATPVFLQQVVALGDRLVAPSCIWCLDLFPGEQRNKRLLATNRRQMVASWNVPVEG